MNEPTRKRRAHPLDRMPKPRYVNRRYVEATVGVIASLHEALPDSEASELATSMLFTVEKLLLEALKDADLRDSAQPADS